jgi:hypothetical protein
MIVSFVVGDDCMSNVEDDVAKEKQDEESKESH